MTLKDSRDHTISNATPPLSTGLKWTPSDVVKHAASALRHNEIVGRVGSKASIKDRRKIVFEEIRKQEEAERSAKAVSLTKHGQWTRWEGLERRKLSWREL